jgi:SAM-dependent methyltransferase
MLVNKQCSAYTKATEILGREIPPPPLGACMIPIVEDYLSLIEPGMRVLDIGCGSWDLIKKYCQNIGAHYEGIDTEPEYFGQKTAATRIENLADLSFPDEYLDLVIGNQTNGTLGRVWLFTSMGTLPVFSCVQVAWSSANERTHSLSRN